LVRTQTVGLFVVSFLLFFPRITLDFVLLGLRCLVNTVDLVLGLLGDTLYFLDAGEFSFLGKTPGFSFFLLP
jgi:hypothetical protein